MNVRVLSMRAAVWLSFLTLTFAILVASAPVASADGSTIAQAQPTTGAITTTGSAGFHDQLNVTGANGAVTYTQSSSSSPLLSVNSTGVVSVSGVLAAGSYTVSGTDSDTALDSGTWSYILTVSAVNIAQAQPTTGAITTTGSAGFHDQLNVTGANGAVTYTPTGGDTTHLSVTGSGVITTNGLLVAGNYSVSGTDSDASGDTGVWTYTLTVNRPGTFNVTFDANGGVGTMAGENASTPTALPLNAFTRAGYTFTKWNTAANGSGASYANGAKYPFTSSTTLYAQWRANKVVKPAVHVVTFKANHGKGAMTAQRARSATALTHNRFTRAGYAFTRWNTAANGSGLSYSNGAKYAFASSITLYAQWSVKKAVTRPVIGTVAALGPFALKSSALSTDLEAQVKSLARQIKASKQTNIALVGYGDTLTAAKQLNESTLAANFKLSQERAANVEAYLKQELAAFGVSHYSIFTTGNGTASTVTSSATAANVARNGHVIASIS